MFIRKNPLIAGSLTLICNCNMLKPGPPKNGRHEERKRHGGLNVEIISRESTHSLTAAFDLFEDLLRTIVLNSKHVT